MSANSNNETTRLLGKSPVCRRRNEQLRFEIARDNEAMDAEKEELLEKVWRRRTERLRREIARDNEAMDAEKKELEEKLREKKAKKSEHRREQGLLENDFSDKKSQKR
ncbi:hypothetical protein MMC22_000354 [Lobaria immixta]|nr:hypothetical protein [Lobaria immixta]